MELKKYLPLGLSKFSDVVARKLLYIDKTDLAADLAIQQSFFFLSRPRRFGKSLLISTFEELFSRGTEHFAGLKIAEQKLWTDPNTYAVLNLDFSSIDSTDIPFAQNFRSFLTMKVQTNRAAPGQR